MHGFRMRSWVVGSLLISAIAISVCARTLVCRADPAPAFSLGPNARLTSDASQCAQRLSIPFLRAWLLAELGPNPTGERAKDFKNRSVFLSFARVPRSRVRIDVVEGVGEVFLPDFELVEHDDGQGMPEIRWYRHPYNRSPDVPFSTSSVVLNVREPFYFSASRSLLSFTKTGRLFSLKLPTDTVRPGRREKVKLETENDIEGGLALSRWTRQIDQRVGAPENVVILTEAFGVSEIETGRGMVVRDLRPMQAAFDRRRSFLTGVCYRSQSHAGSAGVPELCPLRAHGGAIQG